MVSAEVFVPYETPNGRGSGATHVRSTLIVSSIQAFRARNFFDPYVALLSPSDRDALLSMIAGTWAPIALGMAHYVAADRLGLDSGTVASLGASVGERLNKTMLSVAVKLSREAGATPAWTALGRAHRLRELSWQGSDLTVLKLGPKEARLDWVGDPLRRSPLRRESLRRLLAGAHPALLQEGLRALRRGALVGGRAELSHLLGLRARGKQRRSAREARERRGRGPVERGMLSRAGLDRARPPWFPPPPTMRSWIILTGEYPPKIGGVAAYTRNLAMGLARAGDAVEIWAPAPGPAPNHELLQDPGVRAHALPDHFGPRSFVALEKELAWKLAGDAQILRVQYVPHMFGMRAMERRAIRGLARRAPAPLLVDGPRGGGRHLLGAPRGVTT